MMTLQDLLNSGKSREEINAILSGSTMTSDGFAQQGTTGIGAPYMPPPELPQNYIRNNTTGKTYDMGESQPQGPALDYSSPIEIGGYGKGYRVKGDPSRAIMSDGRIIRMGADTRDDRARMLEDLKLAQARQQLESGGIEQQINKAKLAEAMGFDPRSLGGAASSRPRDLKLKPGEAWDEQTKSVIAVPGSSIYRAQDEKHTQDADALDAVRLKTSGGAEKVSKILGDKDGFESNFGGYNAYLSRYLPGANDTRREIESLKANLKSAGLEMMRTKGSIGAMTEREWPIVESMIANITPDLSETEAKLQLEKVAAYMKKIADNAENSYSSEWGDSQYAKKRGKGGAPSGGKHVTVTNDAEYNALPSGAIYTTPDGATRMKR